MFMLSLLKKNFFCSNFSFLFFTPILFFPPRIVRVSLARSNVTTTDRLTPRANEQHEAATPANDHQAKKPGLPNNWYDLTCKNCEHAMGINDGQSVSLLLFTGALDTLLRCILFIVFKHLHRQQWHSSVLPLRLPSIHEIFPSCLRFVPLQFHFHESHFPRRVRGR